ncbi:MAG: flagellar hook-basal body complex protein [Alphaproteobacteria bacterium]|nr:flagellar hook-basal body complex protein [Alphaproteobacteria bacterium]
MGISSSLNAGVMGLSVNATKLATISENIANSATPGYKRVDTEFNSMVLQSGAGTFTAGGVRATTQRFVTEDGPLQSTGNSTDISVSGAGFLPVTNLNGLSAAPGARDLLLVTTGSFRPDESGNLRTSSGQFLMGWPIDGDGNVIRAARDSAAGLQPINVRTTQLSSTPTTNIDLGVNLPATSAQPGAQSASFEAPIEYFDNLGRSQVLTVSFSPTIPGGGNPNEWTVEVYDGASNTPTTPLGSFTVAFSDTLPDPGTITSVTNASPPSASDPIYDPATGLVTVPGSSAVAGLARGPITLNIGLTDGTSKITQIAADFSPIGITKNGASVGNLTDVEIGPDGILEAVFDNGFRQPIFQVPVADVPNADGLAAADGQAYRVSQNSGSVFFYDAGTGPVGTTAGFALEGSSTDIAAELTDLIETQRAYSSNARIIQTVDEVLEETANLKR